VADEIALIFKKMLQLGKKIPALYYIAGVLLISVSLVAVTGKNDPRTLTFGVMVSIGFAILLLLLNSLTKSRALSKHLRGAALYLLYFTLLIFSLFAIRFTAEVFGFTKQKHLTRASKNGSEITVEVSGEYLQGGTYYPDEDVIQSIPIGNVKNKRIIDDISQAISQKLENHVVLSKYPKVIAEISLDKNGHLLVAIKSPQGDPVIDKNPYFFTFFPSIVSVNELYSKVLEETRSMQHVQQRLPTAFELFQNESMGRAERLRKEGVYGINFSLSGYDFQSVFCEFTAEMGFSCEGQNNSLVQVNKENKLRVTIPSRIGNSLVAFCPVIDDTRLDVFVDRLRANLVPIVKEKFSTLNASSKDTQASDCEGEIDLFQRKTSPNIRTIIYRLKLNILELGNNKSQVLE